MTVVDGVLKTGDACLDLEHTSCGVTMWMRRTPLNYWMLSFPSHICRQISEIGLQTACLKDARRSVKGRYWQCSVPSIL